MNQFTPAELAAAEEAFQLHKQGKCQIDCGFCEDLFLSHDPKHHAEHKWIRTLRAKNLKQLPLPMPKRSKAKTAPLQGRVKKGR